MSAVLAVFLRVVYGWYRRQANKQGHAGGRCGSVTFVQRFGSSINLNPHFHVLFLDGVYVPAADGGAPVFVAAPPLADEDVQEIVETAAQRIVRLRQRRGLLDDSLVDEPRRHEPPEWRSGALEFQCGASQKVLRREPIVVQRGIRCPYPSKLGSPLSQSCD